MIVSRPFFCPPLPLSATVASLQLDHLRALEAESIQIMREVVAEFERPVMLYSIGKDSSVLLRLAQKAFYPGPIPFPLLHVDTTYKFREMIEFRDEMAQGSRRAAHRPHQPGSDRRRHAAVQGGHAALLRPAQDEVAARRPRRPATSTPPSAARAATRSARAPRSASSRCATPTASGIPKRQRPELWNLLNARLRPGESIRVFPLSNWTEIDVWQYIHVENIPIVPLYFAKEREVIVRGASLIVQEQPFVVTMPGEKLQKVKCRMRSLGCSPCTGAIRSDADTVPKIIEELIATRQSERQLRIIDHDQDGSMELKKREGYF